MKRFTLIMLVVLLIVLSVLSTACSSNDGEKAVNTLLFTTTQVENEVQQALCNDGNDNIMSSCGGE